jgi:hypothetical protein
MEQEMSRQSPASRRPLGRWGLAALAALAISVAAPAAADASHIKGGTLSAAITVDDQVTGHAAYYEDLSDDDRAAQGRAACTVGDPDDTRELTISIAGPNSATGEFTAELTPTVCPSNGNIGIFEADFTADLASTLGVETVEPGEYVFSMSDCCMVGGILNAPDASGFTVRSRVVKVDGQAAYAPQLPNSPRLGIPIGSAFSDSFAPTISSGPATFTYASLAGQEFGPDTDTVDFGADGSLTIPASETGAMTEGDAHFYAGRVTHTPTGNYSERSIVLIAGLDDGLAPPPPPPPTEEPKPNAPVKPVIGKNAEPLPDVKGLSVPISCPQACTVFLSGHRSLKKKTKEPNWEFKKKIVNLPAGSVVDVELLFRKQLRKTVLRGLEKGINPIKFKVTVVSGDQRVTRVVSIEF